MSATPTPLLRLLLQSIGSNPTTWGAVWNNSVETLMDTAIAGETVVDMTGASVTLTTNDGAADTARSAILKIINGGPVKPVILPALDKIYVVANISLGDSVLKTPLDAGVQTRIADGIGQIIHVNGESGVVTEVGFGANYYPRTTVSGDMTVPINNSSSTIVTTANLIQGGICTLNFRASVSSVFTGTDWVIPVFSVIGTDYQPVEAYQFSGYANDVALVARSCTFSIDPKGGGDSIRITRNDGLAWGVGARGILYSMSFTYPLIG